MDIRSQVKFDSERNEPYYSIQAYHPIALRIYKRNGKFVVAKRVGSEWRFANAKATKKKKDAVSFATKVLQIAIQYERELLSQSQPKSSSIISRADALEVLGLGTNANEGEIKAAHRRLTMALHPDKGGSKVLMSQINVARDVLLGV